MLQKCKHVTGINQSSKWLPINFKNNYFIALYILVDYDFYPDFPQNEGVGEGREKGGLVLEQESDGLTESILNNREHICGSK